MYLNLKYIYCSLTFIQSFSFFLFLKSTLMISFIIIFSSKILLALFVKALCHSMTNSYSQLTTFPRLLPFLLPLIHIALTGSVYTTIAVACERCITVLAPFTQIKVTSSSLSPYYFSHHMSSFYWNKILYSVTYLRVWTKFQEPALINKALGY